jgi:hypothetical protein
MGTSSTTTTPLTLRLSNIVRPAVTGAAANGTTHGICESCRVGTLEMMRLAAEARFQFNPSRWGFFAADGCSED